MRSGNDLELLDYNIEESFYKQIEKHVVQAEDKALLKIVNRNDTFYLESATYQHHLDDINKLAAD